MSDWTKELFEDHAQLFLGAFEKRVAQAPTEVSALLGHLKEQGFSPQRILDLNCGIGRHSIELGGRGIKVVGTDMSKLYIETAQKRAEEKRMTDSVRFMVADMREIASALRDEEPFDGVVNLWTSFGFYDDRTNNDILRQCNGLVRDGGFFALDIINRDWLVRHFQERGFHRTGDVLVLEERNLELTDSRMYNTWTFLREERDGTLLSAKAVKIDHRVWSLHELIQMFERNGWRFKTACAGLSQEGTQLPLMDTRQLLVIAAKG